MIPTELYKVFYIVASFGNISQAAESLFISQPAVSRAIQKLEELSSCSFFIRSSKGVTLTSEGKILYEHVQKAFNHIQLAEKTIQKLTNKEAGTVKIGISNTLCKYYLLPYLKKFHEAFPHIKIQIINLPSPNTFSLLDNGQIDFAIISIAEDKNGYEYIRLISLQDIFVTTQKYDINTKVPLENLGNYPLMMLEKGNQTRIYVDQFLASNNIVLTPEIEIGSMDFLIEFAKIGIGIACVIKEFVTSELSDGTLNEIPISPAPLPRGMGIVIQKNIPLSNATKTFIDFLIQSSQRNE